MGLFQVNMLVSLIQRVLEVSRAHLGSQFTPGCISAPRIRSVVVLFGDGTPFLYWGFAVVTARAAPSSQLF